jgi:hypothetical protein
MTQAIAGDTASGVGGNEAYVPITFGLACDTSTGVGGDTDYTLVTPDGPVWDVQASNTDVWTQQD